ncbi:MAG: hypothetical protein KF850_23210 [Labilithrix sp.]|nr:hypothetical protein [Labilithrix sp.]
MVLRAVAVGLASLLAAGCVRGAPIQVPTVVFVDGVGGDGMPSTSGEAVDDGSSWKPADEVEVEWRGTWWPAVVLEKRGGERWLVHYEGYGSDWDEVVGGERVRARRAEPYADEPEDVEDEPDP